MKVKDCYSELVKAIVGEPLRGWLADNTPNAGNIRWCPIPRPRVPSTVDAQYVKSLLSTITHFRVTLFTNTVYQARLNDVFDYFLF